MAGRAARSVPEVGRRTFAERLRRRAVMPFSDRTDEAAAPSPPSSAKAARRLPFRLGGFLLVGAGAVGGSASAVSTVDVEAVAAVGVAEAGADALPLDEGRDAARSTLTLR